MPCAPMPLAEDKARDIAMNSRVVTLTGFQPYYRQRSLIPHLAKKAAFWEVEPPAVSNAVLQFKRLTDARTYEKLQNLESAECGKMPPLARRYHFDLATGRHMSAVGRPPKGDQSWMKQGTTSKATSFAGPPRSAHRSSSSVSGLTQQFEQLSVNKGSNVLTGGTHPGR